MHHTDADRWCDSHAFHSENARGERGTRLVVLLTAVTMVGEVAAGWLTNSMALLADGWHMGTHVAALGVAAFAYWYARRHAAAPRFAFGTGKVGVLAGFASAIVLGLVALYMAYESLLRVIRPLDIRYDEAVVVAVIGLLVNLLSARLLHGGGSHDHGHGHDEGGPHGHHDLNLRAAYLHVLADALTSVLAIAALLGGWAFGWGWLDPVMGVAGAVVISVWAWGLVRQTSRVLLDREMDAPVVQDIRDVIEGGGAVIVDLHVWRVGPGKFACIVGLVTARPEPPDHYKDRLRVHEDLVHVTVEVRHCPGEHPPADVPAPPAPAGAVPGPRPVTPSPAAARPTTASGRRDRPA
ncbi:CDF family Co(II)/Ni(II) efflux transporter DmeF [Gemmata sp.]|uniref:CDF family Co(II)/Ni(II) efflux transporter DmeF n=1 Tax=Gemmata sp. TaxID=1914242 RepID=UPI003F6FD625